MILTLSGQATAQAAGTKPPSHTPVGHTSPAHGIPLPTVPAAAEPLLKHLVAVAGTIASDNEQVAALSEQHDLAVLQVLSDETKSAALDTSLRRARTAVEKAKLQLRQAAIETYVTGDAGAMDSSLLNSDLNSQSMITTYATVATGDVNAKIHQYDAALGTAERLASDAHQTAVSATRELATISALKKRSLALEWAAYTSLNAIKTKLMALVGPKEFARLLAPQPVGSAYRGPNLGGSRAHGTSAPLQALAAIVAAKKLLGVPYVYGGAGLTGVDCSGLTMLAWAAGGVHLEHSATVQWEQSVPVPLSQLRPGDLLFYHFANDGNTPITHVVMYVGSGPFGAATVIQAAHAGTVVSYAALYFGGLVGAGRP
jgi:cell wall-associated NlpC family hydrolase